MTPYDIIMWSLAVVVGLVCLLMALLLLKGIFITLTGDDKTPEGSEDPEDPEDKKYKGFRRIK